LTFAIWALAFSSTTGTLILTLMIDSFRRHQATIVEAGGH
jgi:hypothetical protein